MPVEKHLAQTLQILAQRLIEAHLVVVAHSILCYNTSVCLVTLGALQGRSPLDSQSILQPHVIAAPVEIVAQGFAVAAGILSAEQPKTCILFVRNSLHPPQQATKTAHLVVKHFVLSLCTLLDSLGLYDRCIKLFFGKIDADKDFFHTFVPFYRNRHSCIYSKL